MSEYSVIKKVVSSHTEAIASNKRGLICISLIQILFHSAAGTHNITRPIGYPTLQTL